MTHPSKDITGSSGTQLSGKKIALLVSSSVASFKVPEIARELMRHGADVYAVISPSTEKLIGSNLLEWATGNPVARENIARLKRIGVEFIEPEIVEGKAKIASTAKIVQAVITRLSSQLSSQRRDLEGHRVLVTAGPTIEHIDPVRVITNRSSGKMGVAIAEEAWARGAETTLILGPGSVTPPASVKTVRVETTEEMLEATLRELKKGKHDLVFAAAAPSDYRPSKPAEK